MSVVVDPSPEKKLYKSTLLPSPSGIHSSTLRLHRDVRFSVTLSPSLPLLLFSSLLLLFLTLTLSISLSLPFSFFPFLFLSLL